jgi:hypothetical protein
MQNTQTKKKITRIILDEKAYVWPRDFKTKTIRTTYKGRKILGGYNDWFKWIDNWSDGITHKILWQFELFGFKFTFARKIK